MLGFEQKKRWVIERLFDGTEWDTLGSIEGTMDADSAIAAARSSWSELPLESETLRAVEWPDATAEQREAATYEDDLRAREAAIQAHERQVIGGLSTIGDVMRSAGEQAQRIPQQNDEVILQTGGVGRVFCVMTRGLAGIIIELENGLFVEVERHPDPRSAVHWREVPERARGDKADLR